MNSNRKLSIAIISILILSAFTTATAPITSAIGDPYIIVYPSSVSPGRTVYVRGYNFEPGNTVDIYCDEVDEYHHLGSEVVNWYGRFYFLFVIQEGYPGTCTIIAVNPPDTYTAEIELSYTNPLDQRLVDIINSLTINIGDVGDKLDDIETKVTNIEGNLVPGGSFYSSVQSWFNGIQTAISDAVSTITGAISSAQTAIIDDIESKLTPERLANIDLIDDIDFELTTDIENTGRTGWTDLASALDDIKSEIETIDGTVDNIWGTVDTQISAIKAKTDTINWIDINNIGNWLDGWFGTDGKYSKTEQVITGKGKKYFHNSPLWETFLIFDSSVVTDKPAKMTLTICTTAFENPNEKLDLMYMIETYPYAETIANGISILPAKTYEFCFEGEVNLRNAGTVSNHYVFYSYVVEYQP